MRFVVRTIQTRFSGIRVVQVLVICAQGGCIHLGMGVITQERIGCETRVFHVLNGVGRIVETGFTVSAIKKEIRR